MTMQWLSLPDAGSLKPHFHPPPGWWLFINLFYLCGFISNLVLYPTWLVILLEFIFYFYLCAFIFNLVLYPTWLVLFYNFIFYFHVCGFIPHPVSASLISSTTLQAGLCLILDVCFVSCCLCVFFVFVSFCICESFNLSIFCHKN